MGDKDDDVSKVGQDSAKDTTMSNGPGDAEQPPAKGRGDGGQPSVAVDVPVFDKTETAALSAPKIVAPARRRGFGRGNRKKHQDLPLPDQAQKRRRRLQWHFGIWTVVLILAVAAFLFLASMSVTGRVVAMPDWVAERVAAKINEQTSPAKVSLSRIELGVTPKGLPRLRFVDLGIRDASGLEVARLNAVEGSVFLKSALSGRFEAERLALTGAQMTVRRRTDGTFDLSFGQNVGASGDLASVLDSVDALFAGGTLAATQDITADGMTITLEDARSGRLWQVTEGRLNLTQDETAVDMTLSFDVFNQTEVLAETVLGFRSVKGSSEAQLTATFKNALSRDIAAQSPLLAFLGVIDAPISGALRTAIGEDGAISDLAGTLEFGAGTLSPDPAAHPVKFTGGKVYLDYEPERERMNFTEMTVVSEWGEANASGHAYLRGWSQGWPTELQGQLQLAEAKLSPPGVFETTIPIGQGAADFRLLLDPFQVDIGQFMLTHEDSRVTGDALIEVDAEDGWVLAIDADADKVSPKQITDFWPMDQGRRSRKWTQENVSKGMFHNVTAAYRKRGEALGHIALSAEFRDVTAKVVKGMVPLEDASGRFSIEGRRLVITAEGGVLRPRDNKGQIAGVLDATGTSFIVPKMAKKPSDPDAPRPPVPAEVELAVSGPVRGMLHLLKEKPFRIFRDQVQGQSTIGPDMATGQARVGGLISLKLQPKIPPDAISYDLAGEMTGVTSDVIVKDRPLVVPRATLKVSERAVQIAGRGTLSGVPIEGTWEQALDNGKARAQSTVTGSLTLNSDTLEAFSIGLPEGSVSGSTTADYRVTLEKGSLPRISLEAPLAGLGLKIAPLGWSKRKSSEGQLSVLGELGPTPFIERVALDAPGLSATGSVHVAEGGGLDTARFDRVRLGGWLDAPVMLTGQGPDKPAAVNVTGGTVDLRRATLGAGQGSGATTGDVPITLVLDRLTISEGISLSPFEGNFTRSKAGMSGTFAGRVGGGPEIRGTAAPQPKGTAYRITASDAGAVLRAAGVFKSARNGKLELILAPGGGKGVYDGSLKISEKIDVHDAPALAELLSAISVVGLLQQLGGQGIPFNNVDARFRLDPDKVTVYESSATGHSMGISMDGYYFLGTSELKMQGVISPFYLVNSAGRIFARKGEGLIGFNFGLEGTASEPRVSVNPLSLFTPGIFRDIFRREPPPRPE